MYYELVLDSPFNRSTKEKPKEGTILQERDINREPYNNERYLSMFGFDHSIMEWMKFQGTVSGFTGNYFCRWLYFDVDAPNLEDSLESARELVRNLYGMLDVNPRELSFYFSGSKGFHIGLHQNLFGGFEPARDLPQKIQILAGLLVANAYQTNLLKIEQEVSERRKEKLSPTFKDIDLTIYNANRIFRTINSVNAKTGLYKVKLTSNELMELSVDQIRELAKKPRQIEDEVKGSSIRPNEDLVRLWDEAQRFDRQQFDREKKGQKREAGEAFFEPPGKGDRNNSLFKQAAMLFDTSELAEESIRQLISCINKASEDPLPEHEITTIVRSANKKTASNTRTQKEPEVKVIEEYADWFDEFVDYYSAEGKEMTCLHEKFDEDMENAYSGKLGAFVGSGGTRKSYAVMRAAADNVLKKGRRVAISSMEMGKVETIARFTDMIMQPKEGISASQWLKQEIRRARDNKDAEAINQYKAEVRKATQQISQNAIFNNKSFLTPEKYREWLIKIIDCYGTIDMLIVDGLSLMGGKGSETEVYSHNSMMLNDIAKEFDIFVALICHVTREAKPYHRDSRPFIRGGEKIADNAYFTLCFSNLIDEQRSSAETIEYDHTYGHMRYYNKRGTGNTFSTVFEFDGLQKDFKPTVREPWEWPDHTTFIREVNKQTKSTTKSDW
jgi:hypothetical protein